MVISKHFVVFCALGVTKTYRTIKYAVVEKGKRMFRLIDSVKMIEKHALDLIEFFESKVELHQFHPEPATMNQFDGPVVNAVDAVGEPKLLGNIHFDLISSNFLTILY